MACRPPCNPSLMCLQVDRLYAGEVGYLAASIKQVADARVGDTITLKRAQATEALAGEGTMWAVRLFDLLGGTRKSWGFTPRTKCPQSPMARRWLQFTRSCCHPS